MAAVVQAPLETAPREAKGKTTEGARSHSPAAFPFDDALNDIMQARYLPQSLAPGLGGHGRASRACSGRGATPHPPFDPFPPPPPPRPPPPTRPNPLMATSSAN